MDIVYQDRPLFSLIAAMRELPGVLAPVQGGYSIQKPNGKYLSVQANGTYEERDSVGGPFEIFTIDNGGAVLHVRPWGAGNIVVPQAIGFRAA